LKHVLEPYDNRRASRQWLYGFIWWNLGRGAGAFQTSRVTTNRTNSAFNSVSSLLVSEITQINQQIKNNGHHCMLINNYSTKVRWIWDGR